MHHRLYPIGDKYIFTYIRSLLDFAQNQCDITLASHFLHLIVDFIVAARVFQISSAFF